MEKILLRLIGFLGCCIFIPVFLFTFSDLQFIENTGKSFIEWQLKNDVNQTIDSFSIENTATKSATLNKLLNDKVLEKIKHLDQKLDLVKEQLKQDTPKLVAEQISKLRNLDCECRKKWEEKLTTVLESKRMSLSSVKNKLIDFTQAKYMEIIKNLSLDVRIFSATNSVVFIFLLIASFFRPQGIVHLFLPGTLLFISTLVCTFFYVFEKNWIYTIIYNDYTGFAYILYLLIVFLFLCDIVFNRGRICTEIINGIFHVIGSMISITPIPC